jgi:hypothetical protein
MRPARAASLASLPLEAQSSISAALGRDIPGYQANSHGGHILTTGNGRQDPTADFGPTGVEVRSHRATWKLSLQGYGYPGALQPAGESIPSANANRVEYRRGGLTEWYVNGPLGLEQGFTLRERPRPAPSISKGQPLTIAMAISGDFKASVDRGATSLTLVDDEGQPGLRYTGLAAYDANGTALRAWLELRGARLLLKIEDRTARYPLVIDPYVQVAKLTASDGQEGDSLGNSAAVAGDTIVVGAPFVTVNGFTDSGAVYVFVKPASGWANMTQTAKLTASDVGTTGISFLGVPVAISGKTIVAGAYSETIGSNFEQGAVYVFTEPAGGWADMTETAKLTASDGAANDRFGCGTSIDGGTIVIGACQATIGSNTNQGAGYVFLKPAGGWQTTSGFAAKLTALDGAANDFFGISTAIGNGTAVIGSLQGPGALYVYATPAGGWTNMTQTAKLTTSDGLQGDELGYSLSIDSGVVLAGAPLATVGGNVEQGAAYVFEEPAGGWADMTQTAKLTAPHGAAHDYFGWCAALRGNKAALGAPGWQTGRGATYLFVKPRMDWAAASPVDVRLISVAGAAGDSLGFAVALSGDTLVTTAMGATVKGDRDQGAAFVFEP